MDMFRYTSAPHCIKYASSRVQFILGYLSD
jgi:hypothetical protein